MKSTTVRKWVLHANDGIISTIGVIEGFTGAGARDNVVLFAAVAVMITGALSLGGSELAEAAQERASELEIIEEEQRQLRLSPEQQHEKLKSHYERRGLDPDLATRVAQQLMRRDPIGAQLETEHGMIDGPAPATEPWLQAIRGVFGFVSGALPLTLAAVFVPEDWRLAVTLAVAALSLAATGLVSAGAATGHPARAVLRSVGIGAFVGVLSFMAGHAVDLIDPFVPQIEIEHTG